MKKGFYITLLIIVMGVLHYVPCNKNTFAQTKKLGHTDNSANMIERAENINSLDKLELSNEMRNTHLFNSPIDKIREQIVNDAHILEYQKDNLLVYLYEDINKFMRYYNAVYAHSTKVQINIVAPACTACNSIAKEVCLCSIREFSNSHDYLYIEIVSPNMEEIKYSNVKVTLNGTSTDFYDEYPDPSDPSRIIILIPSPDGMWDPGTYSWSVKASDSRKDSTNEKFGSFIVTQDYQ